MPIKSLADINAANRRVFSRTPIAPERITLDAAMKIRFRTKNGQFVETTVSSINDSDVEAAWWRVKSKSSAWAMNRQGDMADFEIYEDGEWQAGS